jgi:hypothetical protein
MSAAPPIVGVKPRDRRAERVPVNLRGGVIHGMRKRTADRDAQPLGLRDAVKREIAVHLERIRTLGRDRRTREPPLRILRSIEESGMRASERDPVRRSRFARDRARPSHLSE